jgi:plastocyanin
VTRKQRRSVLAIGFILSTFMSGWGLRGQEQDSSALGTVQGKISIAGPDEFVDDMLRARAVNRYESPGSHLGPVQPYGLSEKAVVFLEAEGSQLQYRSPSARPKLSQSSLMFRPLVLPILVGTTVDFPNDDNLFHNVFSYSQPKEFDLGLYPRGETRTVTFDKPGIVKVYCDIHSHMYATILVLRNPYFAVPDDRGSFRIDNVPPGTYKLKFWYDRDIVETRRITLKANETRTENFSR